MDIASPQPLERRTVIFVHANTANEFIRLHLCLNEGESSDVFADIYSTNLVDGQYQLDTKLADLSSTGANISCSSPMDSPLPAIPAIGDTMQFEVPSAGVYGISFDDQTEAQRFFRWDISLASSATSPVDPTANVGNIFSYQWDFFTDSFAESAAVTTQMYILVPGGFPNTNYVWALDLQGFSGNRYDISANDIGLDAPFSGFSAPKPSRSFSEKYPIYLSYPDGASPFAPPMPSQIPGLTDTFTFTDSAGNDDVFSPDGDATEETGNFTFTPDVSGTYAITIDINRDGDFGAEDRLLLGTMEANTLTTVNWDGLDSEGNEVAQARYNTRLQLRVGEYHFIADDVETSGGGTNNGLTIFQALDDDTFLPTQVFWDDQTLLGESSTLPNGVLSAEDEVGPYRHTWGAFVNGGIGNDAFIDTYVYGNANSYTSTATVVYANAPQISSNGGDFDALVSVDENTTAVTTVVASGGSGTYSYALSEKDASLFSVTPAGVLSFSDAPDFELPSDDNADNDYIVVVGVNDGVRISQQAITVRVQGVNDAPVATPQTVSLNEGTATAVVLSGTDVDSTIASFTVLTNPTNGSLSGTAPNLTYTPNAEFSGADSFTFSVTDNSGLDSAPATISLSVAAQNDVPVANPLTITTNEDTAVAVVLDASDLDGTIASYNVFDPNNGSLSGEAPNLTYTPNPDFFGSDTFSYSATDDQGGVSNTASVSVTVNAVNDAPIANMQTVNVVEDSSTAVTLSGSDVDGNIISFELTSSPSNGVLAGTAPNFTYTPNANFFGMDSLSFTVTDNEALVSSVAVVSINVQSQNDLPTANPLTVSVDQDNAVAVVLSGTDVDGTIASFFVVNNPSNGVLSGTAPNLTYTPNTGFSGADSFTYTVTDDQSGQSEPSTVNIAVGAFNGVPIALNQTIDVVENQPQSITLTGSDTEGDTLTFTIGNQPSQGNLSGNVPNLTYTPIADFTGSDSFTFLVNDGETDSAAATITISVLADLDGDRVPDINDSDDDGDGIDDSVEGNGDPDGDMIPNSRDPDSDGDGRLDSEEGVVDTDGDGAPDYLDTSLDEDRDGIPDIIEGTNDGDNDGLPNFLDLDSDRDGLPDALEALSGITPAGTDADFDGIDDAADIDLTGGMDANSNGIDDAFEPIDTDGDGAADYIDPDSDNDGLPDAIEAPLITLSGVDSDLDGIDDFLDVDQTGGSDQNGDGVDDQFAPIDTDRDGLPDYRDIDSDSDGITDSVEADVSGNDTDGDGIDDLFDVNQTGGTDADNDGVDDNIRATDIDSDGVPDYRDLDSDNDSVTDVDESGLVDADRDGFTDDGETTNVPQNSDVDPQPDFRDLDSDNDGTSDIEAAGNGDLDADGNRVIDDATDTDGDGIADVADLQPTQAGSGVDADGDGIANRDDLDDDNDGIQDIFENIGVPTLSGRDSNNNNVDDAIDAALTGGADINNDGIDDALDGDTDNDGIRDVFDLDSDNDGIADINEGGFEGNIDADRDGTIDSLIDADENGLDDRIAVVQEPLNTDADSLPDFQDLDSDNDGLTDLTEAGLATSLDANQDGVLDSTLDTDRDGLLDIVDADIDGSAPGTPPSIRDTDGDGEPNYRDLDSDGDGFPDRVENADFNNDGVSDALQNDDRTLEAAISGAGSVQFWMLGFLTMLVFLRKFGASVKSSSVAMLSILCAVTFFGAYAKPSYAGSAQECAKQGDESFNRCFYAGAGFGLSYLEPAGETSGWSTDNTNSAGFELHLGQKVTPHWFWELSFLQAGEAGLGNVNPDLEALISDAAIEYTVPSLFAGYTLWDKDAGFNIYGKVGLSAISASATDDRIGIEDVSSVQLALGAGVQYRFDSSPWFAQLQLDSFDQDAKFLSLRLSRYFGSPKRSKTKATEGPVASADQMPKLTPTIIDDDSDGVANASDECPSTKRNAIVDDQGCAFFDGVVIDGVNFETNNAVLTEQAKRVLDGSAETLSRFPKVRIEIHAHTDNQGDEAYNLELSQARATAVVEYLISKGLPKDRLFARGFGESRPIATNKTSEGRAKNRRVELSILD